LNKAGERREQRFCVDSQDSYKTSDVPGGEAALVGLPTAGPDRYGGRCYGFGWLALHNKDKTLLIEKRPGATSLDPGPEGVAGCGDPARMATTLRGVSQADLLETRGSMCSSTSLSCLSLLSFSSNAWKSRH
jgi:hypothetical protein